MRVSSERVSTPSLSLASIIPPKAFDFYENNLPARNVGLFFSCVKLSRMLHCINSMQVHRIQARPVYLGIKNEFRSG